MFEIGRNWFLVAVRGCCPVRDVVFECVCLVRRVVLVSVVGLDDELVFSWAK